MESPVQTQQRTFTVDDVLQMVEAGILGADEHVELLDGVLREMSPQGPAHRSLTIRIRRRLERHFGDRAHVQAHSNLRLDRHNLPEPDVALVRGSEEAYFERLPTGADVLLAVEVSVTSQRRDRAKADLYSRTGVAEYWLIDVPARTLTVHRQATLTGYARIERLAETDQVALPEASGHWAVSDLLPPAS